MVPDSSRQAPECSICSERYDDSDEDLIPRNLACGHSLCSSKLLFFLLYCIDICMVYYYNFKTSAECIFRCMFLNGQATDGGTLVSCPSKCATVTLVPNSSIQNLPKNFAVMEIIQDVHSRERSCSLVLGGRGRSPSLQTQSGAAHYGSNNTDVSNCSNTSEEYKCDVCETTEATIVCPSCAVCLCPSCSGDIHSRKGYHLHHLMTVLEYLASSESLPSSTGSFVQRASSESDILASEERTCKHHSCELTEYACETCCEEICKVCKTSAEHRTHDVRPLVDIAADKKEALKRAVNEIEDCHSLWNKGFDECHLLQENLYDRSRKVETDIKTHFHAVHSLLHAKEETLLSQLREEVDSRVKSLKSQAE